MSLIGNSRATPSRKAPENPISSKKDWAVRVLHCGVTTVAVKSVGGCTVAVADEVQKLGSSAVYATVPVVPVYAVVSVRVVVLWQEFAT